MEDPDISHITESNFQKIYSPSEDTFLLCDALADEVEEIRERKPKIGVEIGTGSGYVLAHVSKLLKNTDLFVFGIDINPLAAKLTSQTLSQNEIYRYEVINCNLLDPFALDRFGSMIDLLIFNPPYVPTESKEIQFNPKDEETWITSSFAGGLNGMEITQKLINKMEQLLSPNGVCYLIAIHENNPNQIANDLAEKGFRTIVVKKKRLRGELLYVLKIIRKK
ncbi:methyltransferase n6amt1 [Anaeramoeba flamelloides]|uniref:Methyltransferase n6amt1 n=1 Tax=Anaeramoeba flamelloides TaxID=1746091 RepID=A0ABQ8Y0X6_9EUKA|nr:methyltransferase n6amt1 [Anaeramoeba flamelloides]